VTATIRHSACIGLLFLLSCTGTRAPLNNTGGDGAGPIPPARLDVYADRITVGPNGQVSLYGSYSTGFGSLMTWTSTAGQVLPKTSYSALWTAPQTYGDVTITASNDTGLIKGSILLHVVPITLSIVQGTEVTQAVAGPVYLDVRMSPDQGDLQWEAPVGTVQPYAAQPAAPERSAKFTPPSNPGSYTTTVRSMDDPNATGTFKVIVLP